MQSRSWDFWTATGSNSLAASPASPSGNLTRNDIIKIRQPVAALVAGLGGVDADGERLGLGVTTREDVDVDAGTPGDGGEQQLDGREVDVFRRHRRRARRLAR